MKLAHRLLLQSVLLMVALIVLIVFVVDRRMRQHMTDQTIAQLARDARFVANQWTAESAPQTLAEQAGITLAYRVTLVDSSGTVVGDSDLDALAVAKLDNHANRPEIIGARSGGQGVSRRLSPTRGDEEWYVAVRIPQGFVRLSLPTTEMNTTLARARRDVLTAGAIALGVAVILTIIFAHKISRPVTQLRDMARALAGHNFRAPPPPNAPGEVGELAITLAQLSGQLEALEKTRRDFVANVSHELRTPLTIVGGFAETLVDDDEMPIENRRQFARTILENTRRMQRIVDDLLDLSRIESGGWIPHPVATDLRAAIAEAVGLVHDTAAKKPVELITHIADDASEAMVDRTALRQVLTNLLENAVRHTPAGGSITVSTEPAESQEGRSAGIWISVRDTGEGMAPEHVSRVFERFYRVDPSRSRDAGGTGLGLSIVRHLTEAHGGYVYATSEVGRGTTIRVFLPR